MKFSFLIRIFFVIFLFSSCKNNNGIPDVSEIPVNISIHRFEKDFFALDTNKLYEGLSQLQNKYPDFLYDFIVNVMGLPPVNINNDTLLKEIKTFIQTTKPYADTIERAFENFEDINKDLVEALKGVKYFFKNFKEPKVYTFIGPINSVKIGFNEEANTLCFGLQMYMGSSFSVYKTERFILEYPIYISKSFDKKYMIADAINNIIQNKIYPDTVGSLPLVYKMIESAKRYYLLDKFLPNEADSIKTGYTQSQLNWCKNNEQMIWKFFIDQDLLYSIDPITDEYLSPGPFTNGMPQGESPGNIGLFVGWQILKKYLSKNKDLSPSDVLKLQAKTIFNDSKYKP